MTAQIKKLLASSCLLLVCCVFIGLALFAPTKEIKKPSVYDVLSDQYEATGPIPISERLGNDIMNIVENRIECYRTSSFNRNTRCMSVYSIALVELGKKKIQSSPNLAAFLDTLQNCPVMHAVCMGEKNNLSECTTFETRCIEGIYDDYWRNGHI